MDAQKMVLRTVYVDPDVDDRVCVDAQSRDLSRAELYRRYLAAGIKIARSHPELFRATHAESGLPLVLRTVYMNPKIDDRLRVEAFDSGTSTSDLMRRYVRLGMSGVSHVAAP